MTDAAVWKEWLEASSVGSEERRSLDRFVSTFGYAYAFLFLERSAKLILDRTRGYGRRFSFGSVWMIETERIVFRFSRDFRETVVELSPRKLDFEWIDDQAAALLLLAGELNGDHAFPPQRIDLPPPPFVIQARFQDLEALFAPALLATTRQRLNAVYRSRSRQGPLQINSVPEPTVLSGSGFLSNYSRLSDDISRVPFWKPLGIYLGMVLLLPFLLLFLLFMAPMRLLRHPPGKRRS